MRLLKFFGINWPGREKKLPEHEPIRSPTPLFILGEQFRSEQYKLTKLAQKYELMDDKVNEE